MKANLPKDIRVGQLEELAAIWGLNIVFDGDSQTLHMSEEDWIGEPQNE